jgi:hypothetical protein
MDLTDLTPEQRTRLQAAVHELVVKISHPDVAEGWDVWWREDYERFVARYPDAEKDLAMRPASLEEAAAFIELLDPTAPIHGQGLLDIGGACRRLTSASSPAVTSPARASEPLCP